VRAGEPASPGALSIVQVVDDLNAGGLERLAIDLGAAHGRAGHQSAIFCLQQRGVLAGQAESAGVDVQAFGKPPGLHLPTLWRLSRALAARRAHVVHSHNPGVHHYAVAAAKLARVPVVVNTRHGVCSSSGARYDERYFRAVLRWTGKVIYVSRDSERYYTSAGIVAPAQGVTIWNGIPLEQFLAEPRRAAAPGRIRLVTLGRLVPVKNHAMLLGAFARVASEFPGAELRIWGEGGLRPSLEALIAKLGLTGRAFLPGQAPHPAPVLSDADAFVFSSTNEGLPMVILEALAAGLPILSTHVGGVPEVAPSGEVAWYCPPDDEAAFAGMLRLALASGELAQRGSRARELACSAYSIEAVQQAYERVYRELLPPA
jgi:glycosyltransferase involved in cell wall biosynthesis